MLVLISPPAHSIPYNLLSYATQVFSMGSLENSLRALSGHLYLPHIVLVVGYILLELMPSPRKKDKDKEKKLA